MAHFYTFYKGILFDKEWSDFTVICGGEHFPLHKLVVVNLPDDDPEVFREFVTYLYTGNYDDEPFTSILNADAAAAAARITSQSKGAQEFATKVLNRHKVPSSETAIIDPAELENHLNDHYYKHRDHNRPDVDGSDEVGWALRKAVDDETQYRGMIDTVIKSLFRAIDLYVMADKFLVDRLRLLALKRFDRACLTLVIEARMRHDQSVVEKKQERERRNADEQRKDGVKSVEDSAAELEAEATISNHYAAMEYIYATAAKAIEKLYSNTPPIALVRSIARFLLARYYPGAHIGWEGKSEYYNETIQALFRKFPELEPQSTKRKRVEADDGDSRISWKKGQIPTGYGRFQHLLDRIIT
ncbi:hypothetical protein SLS62_007107 [Diatrype stigma]|uniref:BTB domain-containing protein n=1 Tax=Diatrype stigma TaxID=117547 RepID=A0AAN9UXE2_9PEZI